MIHAPVPVVARETSTVPVGNRRGRVQHVAALPGPAPVTPSGQVRHGRRPVCGQRACRWALTADRDPRPLCARCSAWAARQRPQLLDRWMWATPDEVLAGLRTVTDPRELHHLVFAICTRADLTHHVVTGDAAYGGRRRLTAYVTDARHRCAHPTRRTL